MYSQLEQWKKVAGTTEKYPLYVTTYSQHPWVIKKVMLTKDILNRHIIWKLLTYQRNEILNYLLKATTFYDFLSGNISKTKTDLPQRHESQRSLAFYLDISDFCRFSLHRSAIPDTLFETHGLRWP